MDWYQWFTGRPDPGRTANDTPALRYLRTPEADARVYGPGAVGGGRVTVPALPQDRAPARMARDERAFVRQQATQTIRPPHWASDANAEMRSRARPQATQNVIGPGGIVPEVDQPPEHVPLAAVSGASDAPFGDDFLTWYQLTNGGKPLPSVLQDTSVPAGEIPAEGHLPNNPNNVPLGVEGGSTVAPVRLERGASDHAPVRRIDLPPIDTGQAEPSFYEDWKAASRRAFERARANRPSMSDQVWAAIFGAKSRRQQVQQENDQMRATIRNGG